MQISYSFDDVMNQFRDLPKISVGFVVEEMPAIKTVTGIEIQTNSSVISVQT